jgi:hypothetical protein
MLAVLMGALYAYYLWLIFWVFALGTGAGDDVMDLAGILAIGVLAFAGGIVGGLVTRSMPRLSAGPWWRTSVVAATMLFLAMAGLETALSVRGLFGGMVQLGGVLVVVVLGQFVAVRWQAARA